MSYPGDRDMSCRARWFRERGLKYEPPKLVSVPPFQCVGGQAIALPRRGREMGEDSEQDVYGDGR